MRTGEDERAAEDKGKKEGLGTSRFRPTPGVYLAEQLLSRRSRYDKVDPTGMLGARFDSPCADACRLS